jgi:hypothetical protein
VSATEPPTRCTLHGSLGRAELCPGTDCSFWNAAEDACVLRDVWFEIACRPPLAEHLLELRTALESG